MHSMGLHSALAIKRQRKRRDEQKKARVRRFSSQSIESGLGESRSSLASPRASIGSLDKKFRRRAAKRRNTTANQDVVSSYIGMLHIGVVFLVLGLFLVGSGLMPDTVDDWSYKNYKWANELVISGVASILLGVFLIGLNKFLSKKEEDDLTDYVQRQLTRSRSGHRLVRDVETGNLTTKAALNSPRPKPEDAQHFMDSEMNGGPDLHYSPVLKSPPPLTVTTPRSDLERILEEEIIERGEEEAVRTHSIIHVNN